MPLLRTDWEAARSAGEVPAGCHNMFVCQRTSVTLSLCLISLRLPLLSSFLLSLSLYFYHLLISSVSLALLAFFFPFFPLSLPVSPCQPVGSSECGSLSWAYLLFFSLSHLLLHLFHFKIRVSWLLYLLEMPEVIVSFIHNEIIRQVYSCPFHFLHVLSFLLYWGIATVNIKGRKDKAKLWRIDYTAIFVC